ncbi:liver carboxylesterase 1F-like [Aplysia californica]|uniref:Liver carboxylesterase 1F-like n=1 Tax=Aplysia californica TaxID=6500 RepID=A0ABM1A394_APLCA|nr:liver carboxylesterase 1F-like [Aplysia californica]
MVNIASDVSMVVPAVKFARALTTASSNTAVYMYLFDHYPQITAPELGITGTSHAMDLLYEFDYTPYLSDAFSYYASVSPQGDVQLKDVFRGTLTQFAKTGDPSRGGAGTPALWPRYDPRTEQYMAISSSPEVRSRVYAKRVSLWTELVPKLASGSRRRGR